MSKDILYFAKTKENAVIPSKRKEDAGYDFYACFDEDILTLPKGKPTLVPTGIACAMSDKYYLNVKHERGSTGKWGMSVLAGVVDSGYRGDIWINIVPLYKDIIISKSTSEVIETEKYIIYPYSKAIAQGTLEFVPDVVVKEISYEELESIPSIRGKGHLGDSGK